MDVYICSGCGYRSESVLGSCPECDSAFENYDALKRRETAGHLTFIFMVIGAVVGGIFPSLMGLERPAAIFGGLILGALVGYPFLRAVLWVASKF